MDKIRIFVHFVRSYKDNTVYNTTAHSAYGLHSRYQCRVDTMASQKSMWYTGRLVRFFNNKKAIFSLPNDSRPTNQAIGWSSSCQSSRSLPVQN